MSLNLGATDDYFELDGGAPNQMTRLPPKKSSIWQVKGRSIEIPA
jgi:hypothetical protein